MITSSSCAQTVFCAIVVEPTAARKIVCAFKLDSLQNSTQWFKPFFHGLYGNYIYQTDISWFELLLVHSFLKVKSNHTAIHQML